jgi:hypothetical protein
MVLTVEEKAARSAERKLRYAEERRQGEIHVAAQKRRYAEERERQRVIDGFYESGEPAISLTLHLGQVLLLLNAVREGLGMMDNGIPTDDELDASPFPHQPGYREHCRFARSDVARVRELHEEIRSALAELVAKPSAG